MNALYRALPEPVQSRGPTLYRNRSTGKARLSRASQKSYWTMVR